MAFIAVGRNILAGMNGFLRQVLFALEPEVAHDIVLGGLAKVSHSKRLTGLLNKFNREKISTLPINVMGIEFPNPVGLAAGLDKQGTACNALHALGFGWIELGTVTPLPQPGNPKPRLFRLDEQEAIINRMGFNSSGLERFIAQLDRADRRIIKGINIGKNAATAMDSAIDDYLACLDSVYLHADYVTINISSPNTKNLRNLQHDEALDQLLCAMNKKRMELADQSGRRVPLVLKISPDLETESIAGIARLSRKHQIDGLAATNTTLSRIGVEQHALCNEVGGLSGPPLAVRSTEIIDHLYRNLQGEIPIIGIGGIDCADRALEKFQAGADLVQIYTGFIYHGSQLIREIIERLQREFGPGHTMRYYLDQVHPLDDINSV